MAKESGDFKQSMVQASDAVIGAALLVGLGVWIGTMLDSKLHSAPWFTITLSLIGAGLGLWRMIRKGIQMGKDAHDIDPLAPGSGSYETDKPSDSPPAPPRPLPQQKSREMKDPEARSSFEFLDQGDSK
ncbi:MAG TPA: AtpZ/AtpI family protein [Candidatus Obscuribacterales bacterium]